MSLARDAREHEANLARRPARPRVAFYARPGARVAALAGLVVPTVAAIYFGALAPIPPWAAGALAAGLLGVYVLGFDRSGCLSLTAGLPLLVFDEEGVHWRETATRFRSMEWRRVRGFTRDGARLVIHPAPDIAFLPQRLWVAPLAGDVFGAADAAEDWLEEIRGVADPGPGARLEPGSKKPAEAAAAEESAGLLERLAPFAARGGRSIPRLAGGTEPPDTG